MNAFEKIKERLKSKHIPYLGLDNSVPYGTEMVKLFDTIEIVNQVAEEYSSKSSSLENDGWIPVSSGNMPETEEPCWITYDDADGKLHVCEDIYCDYGGWYETEDIAVKAWMYVNAPAPYQPKGEK